MGVSTLVSVEEYLRTSYSDGDREYIDGKVVERNMGTMEHADWQTGIALYLRTNYKTIWTGVEVHMQVAPTRYRVPDVVCIKRPVPSSSIIKEPPILVIEVLSPNDGADYVQEKIDDYLAFGIPCVWVLNPRTRRGYMYTAEGMREAKDGVLRTADPEIAVPLAEIS
jgi:Uma2 family endonuclease